MHLTGQSVPHAGDEMGLLVEVGDDRRDVCGPLETEKRGTALEVEEDQVQRVRRMRGDQTEGQRAQQLRLTRPSSPDTQPVGSHTVLSGFLEVQLDRCAVVRQSYGYPQEPLGSVRTPDRGGIQRRRVGDAEQTLPTPRRRANRRLGDTPGAAGQPPGAGGRLIDREPVGEARAFLTGAVGDRQFHAFGVHHHATSLGLAETQHGHTGRAGRERPSVDDQHNMSAGRPVVRCPLQPLPLTGGRGTGFGTHGDVLGTVQGDELADRRPDEIPHRHRVAGETDHPRLGDPHGER